MPLIEPHFLLSGSGGNENNSNNDQQEQQHKLIESIKKNNILDFKLNSSFNDDNDIGSNNSSKNIIGTSNVIETDPSILQLLQTIIQLIYQSRSNSSSLNQCIDSEDNDPFQLSEIEGGSFQSVNLNINSTYLRDKEINLELEEINEINRDLSLWFEHLNNSPLKLDIFTCTDNQNSSDYEHILLERWMLSFTPKRMDSLQNLLNRSLTISDEIGITNSPLLNSFENDVYSGNGGNIVSNHITSSPIYSSKLIKTLYYTLSAMPLYKELLNIGTNSTIKYGTLQYFPPPINFQPTDYKDLVKINFPVQVTAQGTLNLTVQFPNRPIPPSSLNKSNIIIYPSRSYSNQLLCNHAKPQLQTSPILPTPSLLKSTLNSSNSSIGNLNLNNSPPLHLQQQQQHVQPPNITSPTFNNFNINNVNSPPLASIPIPIKPNISLSNKSNNVNFSTINTTTTSNNINITPPLVGQQIPPRYPNRSPSSISLSSSFEYNSTPPSLSSFSPIHNHFKSSTSPKFSINNSLISPPSSPYRVGYRPLFSDINPTTNDISNTSNNNSNNTLVFTNIYSNSPTISPIKENEEYQHQQQRQPNRLNLKTSFGSFQESILSGNMSNTPHTEFIGYLCDLGASGKDMIPPHKKIPFMALYYHVNHDTPYVGNIDLGSKGYRVPEKGLIQLTVFNPCGTPIKTFLVNYDLTDMKPETKTFIRQKIISNDQSSIDNNNNNTSTKELNISDTSKNDQILKYAIHLRFISPKKKKYYLYKNIRVVFANRIPDEMEKLKVIYEYPPSPKYFKYNSEI